MRRRPIYRTITLFCTLSLLCAVCWAEPQERVLPGRKVLTVTYQPQYGDTRRAPMSIGTAIVEDTVEAHGRFLGTDWAGDLFFMDQLSSQYQMLKCFNREGRLKQTWEPLLLNERGAAGIGVTGDGFIWLSFYFGPGECRGLPAVAYRFGTRQPVVDWRDKLPQGFESSLQRALTRLGRTWTGGWEGGWRVEAGPRQVHLLLSGEALGESSSIANAVSLVVDGGGTRVQRLELLPTGDEPILAPNGELWRRTSDLSNTAGLFWSRVSLTAPGGGATRVVVDRKLLASQYPGLGLETGVVQPDILMDGKDNLYVIWTRRVRLANQSGKDIQKALFVFNRRRQLIGRLPWTGNAPAAGSWIAPLPEGTGFYRIEYLQKQANVYLYTFSRSSAAGVPDRGGS